MIAERGQSTRAARTNAPFPALGSMTRENDPKASCTRAAIAIARASGVKYASASFRGRAPPIVFARATRGGLRGGGQVGLAIGEAENFGCSFAGRRDHGCVDIATRRALEMHSVLPWTTWCRDAREHIAQPCAKVEVFDSNALLLVQDVHAAFTSAWIASTCSSAARRASSVMGPMRCWVLRERAVLQRARAPLAQPVPAPQLTPERPEPFSGARYAQLGQLRRPRRAPCRWLGERAADAAGARVDLLGLVAAVRLGEQLGRPVAELGLRRPVLQPLPHVADAPVQQRRERVAERARAASPGTSPGRTRRRRGRSSWRCARRGSRSRPGGRR
jgi:hypothetical protein